MAQRFRLKALRGWIVRNPFRAIASASCVCFVLLNVWSYTHVRAMTHYSPGGASTIRPEEMSAAGKFQVLLAGVNVPRPSNSRTPADVGLPFSTERTKTADGFELEAWHVPADKPRAVVALFHGYASSKAGVLNEAKALHELGYDTLLVDFRGSEGSDGDATTLGWYEAADVVAAGELARRLTPDVPLFLFGRSMGSVAILRAVAVEGLEPAGVILECPFETMLGTVQHRFTAMRLPSFPCAQLMLFWGGVQHGINGFAHNPVEYAAHVTCPALLLQGDQDRRVPVTEAAAIFGALAGEKRLEIFAGVGHEACCRTQPELWERCVGKFLDGHAK